MTFGRAKWFALPLALRQRWWRETDYGRIEPSADLVRAISDYDAAKDFDGSINACYAAVRERVAAGGPMWEPPK